jgi:hypothetical protein
MKLVVYYSFLFKVLFNSCRIPPHQRGGGGGGVIVTPADSGKEPRKEGRVRASFPCVLEKREGVRASFPCVLVTRGDYRS